MKGKEKDGVDGRRQDEVTRENNQAPKKKKKNKIKDKNGPRTVRFKINFALIFCFDIDNYITNIQRLKPIFAQKCEMFQICVIRGRSPSGPCCSR